MAKVDSSLKARHVLVTGDTGSGKTAWTKQQIAKVTRLLIWDPDDEYGDMPRVERFESRPELLEKLKTRKRGRFAFVSHDMAAFDWWCRAAFAWGDCVAVADEIADVTSPGKAPPGWGKLVRRGRKRGIQVYGITQRPAESDKTIWTQAAEFHVGMMPDTDSCSYVARRLGLEVERIQGLGPLEWIHYDKAARDLTSGRLKF